MIWRTIQLAEIDVHLKYDEILTPRVRDFVLMERFMEEDLPTEIIDSLSRVRGKLGCLFFSDIVTADGKFIEDFALDSSIQRKVTTRYSFPREEPTMSDWEAWTKYWAQHTNEGHTLHVPLGVWTNPTHRIWGWYYDEEKDSLQQVAPEGTVFSSKPTAEGVLGPSRNTPQLGPLPHLQLVDQFQSYTMQMAMYQGAGPAHP